MIDGSFDHPTRHLGHQQALHHAAGEQLGERVRTRVPGRHDLRQRRLLQQRAAHQRHLPAPPPGGPAAGDRLFNTGAYQDTLGGFGGIQHCLIPKPKRTSWWTACRTAPSRTGLRPQQSAERMLQLLGYLPGRRTAFEKRVAIGPASIFDPDMFARCLPTGVSFGAPHLHFNAAA